LRKQQSQGATAFGWRQYVKYSEPGFHQQKIAAFEKIHADFKEILKHEKCRSCSCFYGDILNSVYEKIKRFQEIEPDQQSAEMKDDFERWSREADFLNTHG
jgi:hypothetical protein